LIEDEAVGLKQIFEDIFGSRSAASQHDDRFDEPHQPQDYDADPWMRGAGAQAADAAPYDAQHRPTRSSPQPPGPAVVREGGIPRLDELRLHQGTIWNWNRPVYDSAEGGHLRIEFRALPAGPTPVDMLASAAFLVGLTIGLRKTLDSMLPAFPFRYADYNFYRAAQSSLDAELLWPTLDVTSPGQIIARDLCRKLLPVADEGLAAVGVADEERALLLGIIRDRLDSNTTPATWQRRTVEAFGNIPRPEALRKLVEKYVIMAATGKPVTEW